MMDSHKQNQEDSDKNEGGKSLPSSLPTNAAEVLRQRAEALHQRADAASGSAAHHDSLSLRTPDQETKALQFLIHELQVHQIELELQNEELRRAMVELDLTKARYFDLYDLAPVGYCTLVDGMIREANLTLATLLGVPRQQLMAQLFVHFIASSEQDIYYQHKRQLTMTGECAPCEVRMVRKNQPDFCAQLQSSISRDRDDKQEMRVVIVDVTQRKAAELERQRLQTQLQQVQRMESLGALAGGVAHDMNNVLAAIIGHTSVQRGNYALGSPEYQVFETIEKAAIRGGKMVRGLLNFARQGQITGKEINLNHVLQDEMQLLRHTTLEKINVVMDLDLSLHPMHGERHTLISAIENICVNAADAMQDQGILTICTRNVSPHEIQLCITDNGCGMSPEVSAHALEPFFTTKSLGKGTGLGLGSVHATVKNHQGRMEIHSVPQQGTCVSLWFPAVQKPLIPLSLVAESSLPSSLSPLRILIVDDDPLVNEAISCMLFALGHQVSAATSCSEGLKNIGNGFLPQLIMLDRHMPGMNGDQAIAEFRLCCPSAPIIIATGRSDQALQELIAQFPQVTLLHKPFGMQDLKRHLAEVMKI